MNILINKNILVFVLGILAKKLILHDRNKYIKSYKISFYRKIHNKKGTMQL